MGTNNLRYNEYYQMQETLDWIYERSINNATKGLNLYNLVISEKNILLAYRIIKSNKGSQTVGADKKSIRDLKEMSNTDFIRMIRERLANYKPEPLRKVKIPKTNGKMRTLSIPTITDRIIQQMFKQILEPICEAKFYKHSYGFRPNRSAQHALARCSHIVNISQCHYVVDIDIKSFFDEVNHNKLIKQLYGIGIKDVRILQIISKMLKVNRSKKECASKGIPQGGILSPLLSNVVLNTLDWWVANQWDTFKSRHQYKGTGMKTALKKASNLKQMYIVRYADDFKIFTNSLDNASRIYQGVREYLKINLRLNISKEKSKITNLRKKKTDFLGFSMKANKKGNKVVAHSYVSQTSQKKIKETIKNLIKEIKHSRTKSSVNRYNLYILGVHNYYKVATNVNLDFSKIAYQCMYTLKQKLKSIGKYHIPKDIPSYNRRTYSGKFRVHIVNGNTLLPINKVKWKRAQNFAPGVNDYTIIGRQNRQKLLKPNVYYEIQKLTNTKYGKNDNLEYIDNRISRYSMQNGKCAVTGTFLKANELHCHHIVPRYLGGTDEFSNLTIVHSWVHILIHATTIDTIKIYTKSLKLSDKEIKKINKLRIICKLPII